MYKVTRLENGLAVATAEMPHMASVSVGIWVGVGGRYEPARLNGVSHFIEHLLFKGTQRRPRGRSRRPSRASAGISMPSPARNTLASMPRRATSHFQQIWEVLADMFLNSTFDPVEIGKERDVIKEEWPCTLDQPHQYVQELLNALMWPDQPWAARSPARRKLSTPSRRKQLLEYQQTNYVAASHVVAVGGRITHAEAVKAVKKSCRKFARGQRPRYTPATTAQTQPVIHLHTRRPNRPRRPSESGPVPGTTNGVSPCAFSTSSWART